MANSPHPFDVYVRSTAAALRVARGALLFALDPYPQLNVERYLAKLDGFAGRVDRLGAIGSIERIAAMRTVLVAEERFLGSTEDYEDPRNSFLNEVIERKRGLPIALSVVWLDVARTLGWPFEGIGMPGHFLVAYAEGEENILLDPFNGGHLVTRVECEELIRRVSGSTAPLLSEHLVPADSTAILTRMLNNLRSVYVGRQQWYEDERTLRRLLALHPDDRQLLEQLGVCRTLQAQRN